MGTLFYQKVPWALESHQQDAHCEQHSRAETEGRAGSHLSLTLSFGSKNASSRMVGRTSDLTCLTVLGSFHLLGHIHTTLPFRPCSPITRCQSSIFFSLEKQASSIFCLIGARALSESVYLQTYYKRQMTLCKSP